MENIQVDYKEQDITKEELYHKQILIAYYTNPLLAPRDRESEKIIKDIELGLTNKRRCNIKIK